MAPRRGQGANRVDGEHVLYRYLQSELLQSDIWLFQMLTARLIVGLDRPRFGRHLDLPPIKRSRGPGVRRPVGLRCVVPRIRWG